MSNEQEKTIDISSSFNDELIIFINNIDSLVTALPLTINAINENKSKVDQMITLFALINMDDKELLQNIVYELANKNFEKATELLLAKKTLTGKVDEKYVKEIMKINNEMEKLHRSRQLILRSFVISLVSLYDAFLGRLIRTIFLVKPEALNASEKNITFMQLNSFNSIQEARESIIEKEIEHVLRDSHSEQFEWLEKYRPGLRRELDIWPTFIEVTERRNLFVHTNGIVSKQYITTCQKNNVILEDTIQVGTNLEIDFDYFIKAYECIFEVGVRLTQVFWRKLVPSDKGNADRSFNRICENLISEGKYRLACKILDFSIDSHKKFKTEENRRIAIINRAQAYKWAGNMNKAKEIIESEDWTIVNNRFKLAFYIILDEFEKADGLVKKIGKNGEISKRDYYEWSLFNEYRKSEGFQKVFEETFGEPFIESHFFDLSGLAQTLKSNLSAEFIQSLQRKNILESDDENKLKVTESNIEESINTETK
jgi:hypothetical protein